MSRLTNTATVQQVSPYEWNTSDDLTKEKRIAETNSENFQAHKRRFLKVNYQFQEVIVHLFCSVECFESVFSVSCTLRGVSCQIPFLTHLHKTT